jgi:hypothetical protein
MDEKVSRRDFLSARLIREMRKLLGDAGSEAGRAGYSTREFFRSYEDSYALTLAYPEEFFIESAKEMGIETKGKDRLQLVKEIVARAVEMEEKKGRT